MRSLDKTFFTFPKSKPEKRCNTGTFPNHPKPAMPFFSCTMSTVKSPSGGILRYAAIVAQDGTPKLWSTPRPAQRTEVPQNSSLFFKVDGIQQNNWIHIRFHDVSRLFAPKLKKVFYGFLACKKWIMWNSTKYRWQWREIGEVHHYVGWEAEEPPTCPEIHWEMCVQFHPLSAMTLWHTP